MSISELKIVDNIVGSGKEVVKGALVICHYTGYLEDGTVFQTSREHGRPFEFVIGSRRVIQGWDLGVMGMKVGGQRRLYIPANLAYGEREKARIPPNSNLIYDVELLEVRTRDE